MSSNIPLEVTQTFEEVDKVYKQSEDSGVNIMVFGRSGSGKTTFSITGRRDVLVHSFDPGGSKSIRDQAKESWLHIDNSFEKEDPRNPTQWQRWDDEMGKLKKAGVFDHLGTYVLDSATTWAQCAMYRIMAKAGRLGDSPPFQQDWLPQMAMLEYAIRVLTALPCDVVLTAHPDTEKDETSGKIYATPMITGKLKQRIPLLFTEVYVSLTKDTSKGTEYQILTQPEGMFDARTRLGAGGRFNKHEEPNIEKLLKKATLPIPKIE